MINAECYIKWIICTRGVLSFHSHFDILLTKEEGDVAESFSAQSQLHSQVLSPENGGDQSQQQIMTHLQV